jgi:hypothetical protein
MMLTDYLAQFTQNTAVFQAHFTGLAEAEYLWRPATGKWNLLEILCHLRDEECDDFRARTRHILETPALPMPPIDPTGWVMARDYAVQDFLSVFQDFINERSLSHQWLSSLPPLSETVWDNVYHHPKIGPMSARFMLANWLAHDFLHLRQIARLRYEYLQSISGQPLFYAGDW